MLLKVELHTHTKRSQDVTTSYKDIIEQCIKNGIDVLAATDHNEIEGALRLAAMAPFRVIVGEEILTKDGEIIGLFLKRFIPPGLSMKETIRRIKKQGGISYLPHPFDGTTRKTSIAKNKLRKIIDDIDIVEVFNGRTIFPWDNSRAVRFAKKHKKPQAAGSDAHTKYEFGRTFIEIPEFSGPTEFLSALKKAKIKTKPVIAWVFLITKWARFKKRKLDKMEEMRLGAICNLCGGRRFSLVYKRRGKIGQKYLITDDSYGSHYQIIRCLDCGLVFTYPRDAEGKIVNKYVAFEDEEYEKERATRGENQKRILEEINSLFAKPGTLLEVGCATGSFLEAAQKAGWEVLGIEPSRWAVDIARNKYNLPVIQGTLTSAKVANRKFDAVVCIDVIEHVTDPKGLLANINKVLKPGGLLCLVTPDRESVIAKVMGERWWHIRPDHIYYFSRNSLFSMLLSRGFAPEKVDRYGWTFSYDYWVSRFKNFIPIVYKILINLKRVPILHKAINRHYHINLGDSLEIYARKT